jgi:hypothetical protein
MSVTVLVTDVPRVVTRVSPLDGSPCNARRAGQRRPGGSGGALFGRAAPDHLAQEVSQLTLLVSREALEARSRSPDAGQQAFAQPPSGFGQHDMLDAPVLGARAAGDESPRLEPVDEPGDVGVVAREERGELGHRQRRPQLKQSSRLRRVEVKLSGGDEKSSPVLSKECAEQLPDLGEWFHLAHLDGRLHLPHSIEIIDR